MNGLLLEIMVRLDKADSSASRAHQDGMSRGDHPFDMDALQERALADAGGGENNIISASQVFRHELMLQQVAPALIDQRLPLLVIPRPDARAHPSAQAAQACGRENAFRRAA